MRVLALRPADYGHNLETIMQMHRLRRRVFRDRLEWEVSVAGDMEIDVYDALGPTYLIGIAANGVVCGCARLLPTTGPHMLANTFPALLGSHDAPRSPMIFESSRFCVDTGGDGDIAVRGLRRATFSMLAAVLEWGLAHRQREVVTVTDVRFERILTRAGWPLHRFAAPMPMGGTLAVAGRLSVSIAQLSLIRSVGQIGGRVLTDPAGEVTAAHASDYVQSRQLDPRMAGLEAKPVSPSA